MNMHRFLVVIEEAGQNYSAYSPDLPGCIATGATREETKHNMYKALQMHIEGLREDDLPIPQSFAVAEYLLVNDDVPDPRQPPAPESTDAADTEAAQTPLTPDQREVLEARWREFMRNPDEGEPWEDVKSSLFDTRRD